MLAHLIAAAIVGNTSFGLSSEEPVCPDVAPALQLGGHAGAVGAVSVLDDGTVRSIGGDFTACVWQPSGEALVASGFAFLRKSSEGDLTISRCRIYPDGRFIVGMNRASLEADSRFVTGTFADLTSVGGAWRRPDFRTPTWHPKTAAVARNRSGKVASAVLSGQEGIVALSDPSGTPVGSIELPQTKRAFQLTSVLTSLDFSPTGDKAICGIDGLSELYMLDMGTMKATSLDSKRSTGLAFLRWTGDSTITGLDLAKDSIEIVEVQPNGSTKIAAKLGGLFEPRAFARVGDLAAVGCWRREGKGYRSLVKVVRTTTGNPIFEEAFADRQVVAADLSPNGRWLAIGTDDGRVGLCDLEASQKVLKYSTLATRRDLIPRWISDKELAFASEGNKTAYPFAFAEGLTAGLDLEQLTSVPADQLAAVAPSPPRDLREYARSLKEQLNYQVADSNSNIYSIRDTNGKAACVILSRDLKARWIVSGRGEASGFFLGKNRAQAIGCDISPNQNWLAVTSLAGPVQLFNLRKRIFGDYSREVRKPDEAATINYMAFDSGDWVLWSPETNYYYGTAAAEERFGFQMQTADRVNFVPASKLPQFRSAENILKLLRGQDVPIVVANADELKNTIEAARDDLPDVNILPGDSDLKRVGGSFKTTKNVAMVAIDWGERAEQKDFDSGKAKFFAEGTKDAGAIPFSKQTRLELTPGRNRFKLAYEEKGKTLSKSFEILYESEELASLPRLMVFAVGISKYEKFGNLDGVEKDREQVREFFKKQTDEGDVMAISSDKVTRLEFLKGFSEFLEKVSQAEKPVDAVLYLSAHGDSITLPDGSAAGVLATSDYTPPGDAKYDESKNSGVLWKRLIEMIGQAQASSKHKRRFLLLLDTCHAGFIADAGRAAETAFKLSSRAAAETSNVARTYAVSYFASCRASEQSKVLPDKSGSIFTRALLSNLESLEPKKSTVFYFNGLVSQTVRDQNPAQTPYFYPGPSDCTADQIVLKRR